MEKFDTSEYKITYILGAGASAHALPTVKDIMDEDNKKIKSYGFAYSLRNFAFDLQRDKNIIPKFSPFVEKMSKDMLWLAENSDKFGTPDTYAKYLYLKDRNLLSKLKETLAFYFITEQFIKQKNDERAKIFLTSVMQIGAVFPTNIKIINWNYDFQIQLAGEIFRNETYHHGGNASVHTPPLITYYPGVGDELKINFHISDSKNISMVHLNGIAGFYYHNEESIIYNDFIDGNLKDMNYLIEKFTNDSNNKEYLITFAWEEGTEADNFLRMRMDIATSIVAKTDVLIIVGYSFPFFNRKIDKQIFEALKTSGKLKKIIYQDPYKSGDFLRKQFGISEDIEIINSKVTNNYYLPDEL